MRLLSTIVPVPVLKTFVSEQDRPPYAVLSPTWLPDNQEVVYTHLSDLQTTAAKPGWEKWKNARNLAWLYGFSWIWIDTTCINKDSSAELSEAINSMFKWYRQSELCIVYLYDLADEYAGLHGVSMFNIYIHDRKSYKSKDLLSEYEKAWKDLARALQACRWSKRGWTLQELLAPAPQAVSFYTQR